MKQNSITKKGKGLRKFIFFYLIINLIAYSIFLLKFHPENESDEKENFYNDYSKSYTDIFTKTHSYILIPNYDIVERCSNCNLKESENFYPFHKFNFEFESGGYNNYSNRMNRHITKGFVGIFGFYGHTEFVFYVIIPFLIFGLVKIYKKYV